jgi:hypothetical protein
MRDDPASMLATVLAMPGNADLGDRCLKTSLLGMAIAAEMGLDEESVQRIGIAGLVHDWGMARIPASIRNADHKLSRDEFFEIVKHPAYTVQLLEKCPSVPAQVALICYQVHERPNGKEYPRNRTGDLIHLGARILSVADTYRALVSPCPFRPPLKPYAAMECLVRQASAGDVDAQAVRALLRLLSLFPVGSYVVLSNGHVARVLRRNLHDFTRPLVRVIQDGDGEAVASDQEAAIIDLSQSELTVRQALPTPGTDETGLTEELLRARSWSDWEESQAKKATLSMSLESYTGDQKLAAQRALSEAQRTAVLNEWVSGDLPQHPRSPVRAVINVRLAEPKGASCEWSTPFRAIACDVSQTGLAFLHPERLEAKQILVGIDLPKDGRRWFEAEIVRRREIEGEGFWEYGVALRRRVVA